MKFHKSLGGTNPAANPLGAQNENLLVNAASMYQCEKLG